jgi:hypothetical protein
MRSSTQRKDKQYNGKEKGQKDKKVHKIVHRTKNTNPNKSRG